MEFKKNQDLAEKPDHAHYPICRGRLDAINNMSAQIFKVTVLSSLLLMLFSFLSIPMHVIGWIPLIFTMEDIKIGMDVTFGFRQMFMCLLLVVISALGCTRHKFFNIIMLAIYVLMLVFSLFVRLTAFDALTAFIGAIGTCVSIGSVKAYGDYKQLMETEGYPIFSITLSEYDEKKKQSEDGYYRPAIDRLTREKMFRERNINMGTADGDPNGKPHSGLYRPDSASTADIGGMPELSGSVASQSSAVRQIFIQDKDKEVYFSDSGLKMK